MSKNYIGTIPNIYVRDFQRQKVYDAEEQCLFWQEGLKNPPLSLKEVKSVVAEMSKWGWIKPPRILSTSLDKTPIAYATADLLVLPFERASSLPYICHEMAHVINYNSDNPDHHGSYFTLTYLNIVKQFISPTASIELRKAFQIKRVKYARA